MANFPLIIILVLLVFSWAQYTYPDKVDGIEKSTWGSLNNKVNEMRGVTSNSTSACPVEPNYVCGSDGKTYLNSCKAAEAGITKATVGACV